MQFLITFGLVINTSLAFTSTVDSGYPYIMVSFVPTKSSHLKNDFCNFLVNSLVKQ